MEALRHFLVIVDPKAPDHPAIRRAAWLAKKGGASLELFLCDHDHSSDEKTRSNLVKKHTERLAELAQPLVEDGLKVRTDFVWDTLAEGIARKVATSIPDIVFKDTHYHEPTKRSLFSHTEWGLIRECPAPLMLVKAASGPAIATIVAAVDPVHERDKPAELDHKILSAAGLLAAAGGGEVHVVHAFDPAPAYAVSADAMAFPVAEPIQELTVGLKRRHEAALAELLARYSIPEQRVHLGEGDTRDVLVELVEELRADVLVIGAVSRGAIQRLLLGNTAARMLDHVPCDLLIIKPSTPKK